MLNSSQMSTRNSGMRLGRQLAFLFLLLALLCGPVPSASEAAQNSNITVWVNTKSGVYHCSGAAWYGKTRVGVFMEQGVAQDKGYRPAYGKVCQALAHPGTSENEPLQDVAGRQCGFERWPVKVLIDQDSKLVDYTPINSSVAKLNSLEVPGTYPHDRRLKNEELHVFRVRARLIEMRDETDSDLHIIIADPDQIDTTMIAEIPAPFCALGSGHEKDYETARAKARQIPLGALVEVEGVGFFDVMHGQSGVAKNGFEIHPVLKITQVQIDARILPQ